MKMGNLELDPLSSPLDGFFAPLQLKRIHRHHVPAVRRLFEACLSLTRASTSEHRRGRAYQRLYSPLHLVPTTCGPSACRTQALSCPLPVCSTASPGPLPAPEQPLGAAYSAGLSLSQVCASLRTPPISSIPAQSFYILCPLRDTDADSLQGFPQYTSLHHPLANVSKSRG